MFVVGEKKNQPDLSEKKRALPHSKQTGLSQRGNTLQCRLLTCAFFPTFAFFCHFRSHSLYLPLIFITNSSPLYVVDIHVWIGFCWRERMSFHSAFSLFFRHRIKSLTRLSETRRLNSHRTQRMPQIHYLLGTGSKRTKTKQNKSQRNRILFFNFV